jgi:hypothetical protein
LLHQQVPQQNIVAIINPLSKSMHHLLRSVVICTAFSLTLETATAQSSGVACDLIDLKSAETLLLHSIKQHRPSRSAQLINGVLTSDCIFFGNPGNYVRVTLAEYRTPAAAQQAYAEGLQPSGYATHTPISNLGDVAAEWHALAEASGYKVVKGSRILLLDVRGSGGDMTKGALQRIKPFVVSAVKTM